MNKLQVFSKDIIPVYITDKGEKVVIGRELHKCLKIGTPYDKWFPRMCEYGFVEDIDFSTFLSESTGGRPAENHNLTLDMAKEIATIQRTPEGHAIRKQLISLDTNIAELSPQLRLLINMEIKQKEQEKALQQVEAKVDGIRELVVLNPQSWREECRRILAQIAQSRGGGGAYQEVNAEVYTLVDKRAGVCLATRLTNKCRRMAEEGVCKSKREKLNKVDVIAEDKKLIEIYIAVVKEMAVKYGVAEQQLA